MSKRLKNQAEILSKLGIEQLNPMQEEAHLAIHSSDNVVLLSPTGTGKTLAFLLPVIKELNTEVAEIQGLIIVPSRELAIQIEQVAREMGTGHKINVVYGGRHISKDFIELKHLPAILVGTPGRVADHLRRGTFSADGIRTLVLDEFDKSLEIGFEEEMHEIVSYLKFLKKRIMTSATLSPYIPKYFGLEKPIYVNYLEEGVAQLKVKSIVSPDKDKLETLLDALCHLGDQPGIIFCNFKDAIQRISDFLDEKGIQYGRFYGGLEQKERERTLIKFRNGTYRLLLATDLAARGIDVPEIKFIIHYHLPSRREEFIHRNGRTARMHNDGTAYVLHWAEDILPDFIGKLEEEVLTKAPTPAVTGWTTLFISGGRKDKISKGDIAGLFFGQGELKKGEVGIIELKQDCAFVAVPTVKAKQLIATLNNGRIKKRKIRVTVI